MGTYRTMIVDPPWAYSSGRVNGAAECHYPTMTIAELAALPVGDLAAPDAVLLLWATWPLLPDALALIAAWGFSYVTGMPWIKLAGDPERDLWGEVRYTPQYGAGFWVRGCTEPILIARRDRATWATSSASSPRTSGIRASRRTSTSTPRRTRGRTSNSSRGGRGPVGTGGATRSNRRSHW